jgi:hypothetical protein
MTNTAIETDYLVVGAGEGGMAFTDSLLTHSDATITIVDRRHAPGGHWLDAYPFVRLHQASAFYGVCSVPLGHDQRDTVGTNAGYYELAGVDEIRAYFAHVMHRHFLPTGRVRYLPSTEYVGDGRIVSRLTENPGTVRVRRKIVDSTYLEGGIPATSPPPFEVADGVRWCPAGGIARVLERAERFVIIGAGKTALDACVWLLEQGVPASAIRWVKPRESWWVNRHFQQPYDLMPDTYRGVAIQLEAMAAATSIEDMFLRLEAEDYFFRIDPRITPTMFRGAVVSEGELALLRQIEDVVRLGHVRRIMRDEIVLDEGRVPTSASTAHIHCAASGLSRPPIRPIFEPGRVTIQPIRWGFVSFQFSFLGLIEATMSSDEEKNRLCPPINYWDLNADYLAAFLAMMETDQTRAAYPALVDWARKTRLNPFGGAGTSRDDPRIAESTERIRRVRAAAMNNLAKLLGRT